MQQWAWGGGGLHDAMRAWHAQWGASPWNATNARRWNPESRSCPSTIANTKWEHHVAHEDTAVAGGHSCAIPPPLHAPRSHP